ncbi:TPA: hypothetical protein ACH3X3_010315 [Trebouxia sp. C0006]
MCNALSQALAETPAKEFEPDKASHMLLSGKATPFFCLSRDQSGRKLTFSRKNVFASKRNAISSVLKLDGAQSGASPGSALDFHQLLLKTQQRIIQEAESLESSSQTFLIDKWATAPSRTGITAVMQDGCLLEKGAVNISLVQGKLTSERAMAMSSRGRGIHHAGGQSYSAAALSLVFHPANPFVPTLRADVRLFQVEGQAWYGGGCDLTPAYLFEDDARQFHSFWKATCDKHHTDLYSKYKAWCDDYFYIPARQEHRGIGGIFFDDLEATDAPFDVSQFVKDVAEGILSSWRDIATKRQAMPFSDDQRQWQLLRRGRYLEFNLLYDRGVKFGLSGGRLESIMVSAPPLIAWRYNVVPEAGSAEAKLVAVLQKPVDWATPTT